MTRPLVLHPDRLFSSDPIQRGIARTLYAEIADAPIISPHGHTDPAWFAEDQPWDDAASLLLAPDHYVFRMLYSQGLSLDEGLVRSLHAGSFLPGRRNVVLVGGTGTGKIHLASAIAASVIRAGARGRYFNTVDLVTQLEEETRIADRRAFLRHLSPVRKKNWVVYAKPPFAGPEAVIAYLSRYTHRVAISNSRLIRFDDSGVTLRYKDYRRDGADRQQTMTLSSDEFIRRFLLHVLPRGFHRIRHYGLLASSARKTSLAPASC